MYPAYTAAGARIHVASDVANNARSHSAPRLPPKEANTPSPAAGTPNKKKLSSSAGGHRVSHFIVQSLSDNVTLIVMTHKGSLMGIYVQCIPLLRSTDVRSSWIYGQFVFDKTVYLTTEMQCMGRFTLTIITFYTMGTLTRGK